MSEKRRKICLNSKTNRVYAKRQKKNKMSTSLHAILNVVSGNVEFVKCIIRGRKLQFSASNQNSISEKSIFGHFEAIFLNV